MKKPIPKSKKRKIIVIAAAAAAAVLVIAGIVLGIRHFVKNKTAVNANGIKYATEDTLKILKEEADKISKESEVFFTLEENKDYEYPTGMVITVEVNDYGKLVVLGNGFNVELLDAIIKASNVTEGADIGITDVVYSIRFNKNNEIETAVGNENDPKSILVVTTEPSTEAITIDLVDEDVYSGYSNKILTVLKSYISDNKLTPTGEILVYTDDEGYLRMSFTIMGFTQEQYDDFVSKVSDVIPLDKFIGYSFNKFRITIDEGACTLDKYNPSEEN